MNIVISRYPCPTEAERSQAGPDVGWPADRWESVIEPEDRRWAIWVGTDGSALFFPERDSTGGAIGPPVEVPALP
ncbi:MAG: hypothetical protein ACRDXE_10500 [Acidimicrobiales bacterium]